jgi:hypothetical protein
MVAIALREVRGALIDAMDHVFAHKECEPIEPQNRIDRAGPLPLGGCLRSCLRSSRAFRPGSRGVIPLLQRACSE